MSMQIKLITTIALLVLPMIGKSQTIISYTYDSAGNRIGRTMIARSLTDSEDLQMSEEASTAVSDGADQFQRASLDARIIDVMLVVVHFHPFLERPLKNINQRMGDITIPSGMNGISQGNDPLLGYFKNNQYIYSPYLIAD